MPPLQSDLLLNRRQWLAASAASLLGNSRATPGSHTLADAPIGCFNRPWMRWSYDEALDGIRSAGFLYTGILGDHPGETFTSPHATPADIDRLRDRIAARDLTPLVGWLRTTHTVPAGESQAGARRQIDHARRLGLRYLLTVGVDPPEQFPPFLEVMSDAARYAADRGIQIVLKPHGGCSATAADMLRCLEEVHHDNFRLWYDAGNIVHYTGRDPVAELRPIADYVTGFCAKDCAGRGQDVMLPFGAGVVDFAGVFQVLREHRFQGPLFVECCGGATPEGVTQGARVNRRYVAALRTADGAT